MTPGQEPTTIPLRDIHLPDPVSWWPPALGWWLLLFLLLALVTLVRWLRNRRHAKSLSVEVQARQEMQRIKSEFEQHQDKTQLAAELSELLRRVCISLFPRQDTASLTGQAWLTYLDSLAETSHFKEGEGRVLIEAPYRHDVEFDPETLIQLVEQWLGTVVKRQGQSA